MIKNWSQFIKESQQLNLFQDEGIFPYTEEDIIDHLLELEDNKYFININFGWLSEDNKFTQKIEVYVENPCILVEINSGSITKSEDVTSSVTSFIKRMRIKAKDVRIYDSNYVEIPVKLLKFKGGIFLNEKPEDLEPDKAADYNNIQLDDGILILCVFNKRKLTYKDIFEYYGIRGEKLKTNDGEIDCLSYNDRGTPIFEVEVDDLIRWVVDKNDPYVKFITNPDLIWDYYIGRFDWVPDHQSFFDYYLSDENKKLLLKVCILKDGWESILKKLDEDITQEDFIQNYKKYRKLGKILKELPNSSIIYDDLRNIYINFEENSKIEEDLKAITSKFDELVEEYFNTTIVAKNNYSRKVVKLNKSGEKYEYNHYFTTYKLLYNNEWIKSLDAETLMHNCTTYTILSEYSSNIYSKKLEPNFSDYVTIDKKEFNKSVKSNLEYYLKKE
jgi:hypothetical protein